MMKGKEKAKELLGAVLIIVKDISGRRIGTYAAAGTFYLFLSLVPLALVVCSLLPYTPMTQERLLDGLALVMPQGVSEFFRQIVDNVYEAKTGHLSVSIILTVWSASLSVVAVMRGMRSAYGGERVGYFRLRFRAMLFLLAFILGLMVALVMMVYGEQLVVILWARLPIERDLTALGGLLRYGIALVMLSLAFMILYRWAPGVTHDFLDGWRGAVFAAVMWLVFSSGFSVYLNYSDKYGVYGVLGSVVIAMLWTYYCMYFLFIGGCINRLWSERGR